MKDEKAIIINNTFLRRQLFNHFYKSEKKYPLDDFWWVLFKKYPFMKSATVKN